MNGYESGRVVISRAGRDAGKPFVVVGREGDHLLLADGRLHKAQAPKKKKPMHVFTRPELISSIRDKLERGEFVADHELRDALSANGYPAGQKAGRKTGEGETWQRAT